VSIVSRVKTLLRGRAPSDAARREKWEQRHDRFAHGATPKWLLDEPPAQLLDFLDDFTVPPGPVCDVGCGPGTITEVIASRLGPIIAVDLSDTAVRETDERLRRVNAEHIAAVVAAPRLPLKDGSISFLFDRGCMHVLPKAEWPAHLDAIARCLRPGGYAQLIEHTLTPEILDTILPRTLETRRVETFDSELRNGEVRRMINAVVQRASMGDGDRAATGDRQVVTATGR
jgi:SAM-dependent methyltransferase